MGRGLRRPQSAEAGVMFYWILVMVVVLQWNARSLLAHGQEYKQFIVYMPAKPDVIYLCAGNMAQTECGVYHTGISSGL